MPKKAGSLAGAKNLAPAKSKMEAFSLQVRCSYNTAGIVPEPGRAKSLLFRSEFVDRA